MGCSSSIVRNNGAFPSEQNGADVSACHGSENGDDHSEEDSVDAFMNNVKKAQKIEPDGQNYMKKPRLRNSIVEYVEGKRKSITLSLSKLLIIARTSFASSSRKVLSYLNPHLFSGRTKRHVWKGKGESSPNCPSSGRRVLLHPKDGKAYDEQSAGLFLQPSSRG